MEKAQVNRYLPAIVFVVVSVIGLGMTLVVFNAEEAAIRTRFEVVADEAVDRIRERITQNTSYLEATHAFFSANRGEVSRRMFATFVDGLEIEEHSKGIQGIGFARMIGAGAEGAISAELQRNYGIERRVWPESGENMRTPTVLIEPNDPRNAASLGYDMFSNEFTRSAMLNASAMDVPQASAPVELVQEITSNKQAGFLLYLPLRETSPDTADGKVMGFVYVPVRAGDLHDAALSRFPPLPIVLETVDVNGSERLLYRSPDYEVVSEHSRLGVERSLEVAGREWRMAIWATPAFRVSPTARLGTFALGAISILLAIALAVSTRAQLMAVAAAQKLQASSEKSLQERELMLQEMKHRIKNSIARVLAIARHTAAHAETIDDFSESFNARLQAMASAQDMLTRSHWQRTDLKELLSKELEQVFGTASKNYTTEGVNVELNERATQALGLVFHELATNALKYGGVSDDNGSLSVSWRLKGRRRAATLILDWVETTPCAQDNPKREGFGTRLMDANVRGELGGEIERDFNSKGIVVQIRVPPEGYR